MAKTKRKPRQSRSGQRAPESRRNHSRGGRGARGASQEASPVEQIMQGVDRLADQFKQRVRRMVKSQITGMGDQNAAVKTAAQQLLHAIGDQFSTRTRRLAETSPFRKRPRS